MEFLSNKIDAVVRAHNGLNSLSAILPNKRKGATEGRLNKTLRHVRNNFTESLGKKARRDTSSSLSPTTSSTVPPSFSTPSRGSSSISPPTTTSRRSSTPSSSVTNSESVPSNSVSKKRSMSPVPPPSSGNNAGYFSTPKKVRNHPNSFLSPPASLLTSSTTEYDFEYSSSFIEISNNPLGQFSVTNTGCRRLSANEIVHLLVKEQIIVVIPFATPSEAEQDMTLFRKRIHKILLQSSTTQDVALRNIELHSLLAKHKFNRNGCECLQFPCSIATYPYRADYSLHNLVPREDVMRHYATGQGMTLALNGYETNLSLLMMFRLIPFLEIYKLRDNDDVFTEHIHFSNNIRDDDRLMEPLFGFLHSYEGDILSTYEILFKYYRCANYINKKQLSTTKRKLDLIGNTPVVAGEPAVDNTVMGKEDFLELLEKEFNNDTLKNFCFDMDALVRKSFTDYYCDYHVLSEYIIDSQDFMAFYHRMCEEFPYHAMAIISIINNNDSMEDVFLRSGQEVGVVAKGNPKERAAMHYFLSMCRVRSQRWLPYWATIQPLAFHGKGYKEPPSGRRKSECCLLRTAFTKVNTLYDECIHTMNERMRTEPTGSYSLDNYQDSCKIINQTDGQSSQFHNGTVYISKRNRYLQLPVGTIISTPSRLRFKVTECNRLSPYMSKVFGCILISTPPLLHPMTKLQYDDSEDIRNGVLLPRIGWKICKFPDVEPRVYDISYIDQFIPSPLNAHVPLGSSDNDILFGTRDYMRWTGEKCVYLNLGGSSKYKLYENGRRVISLTTLKQSYVAHDKMQYLLNIANKNGKEKPVNPEVIQKAMSIMDNSCMPMESFTVNRHFKILKRSRHIVDLSNFRLHLLKDDSVDEIISKQHTDSIMKRMADALHGDSETVEYDIKAALFVNAMRATQSQVDAASKYGKNYIRMCNPDVHCQDQLHEFPLIPRDEVSREGSLLTHLSIAENLQLLEKKRNFTYAAKDNVEHRTIFQYGDVLTDVNWNKLKLFMTKKLTNIGQQDEVTDVLKSLRCIVMQHGYLHENMHRCDCIYNEYMGALLQPLTVLLKAKRINGDPLKTNFKDHEEFLMRIFRLLKRYRLEKFVSSMDVTILHKSENENNAHIVCRLEEAYLKFREKFESSNDEVSKMISMFLVKMESYARCKFSVRNADAITMEKEGCEWIPYWKQSGKKQYFQAGIRRIETLYKSLLNGEISEEDFEIMRRNRFCRLTLGKGALAMDELCELMNYFMKSVVYSPYFDTTCERSKHVPLMRRCAIELWGHTEPRSSVSCGSTSDYKLILEMCNNERIFSDEIGARILDETCFWRFIKQDKSQKGGSTRQRAKDSVPLTPHESSFLSRTNNVDINEIDAVFDENDDEDRSTCSSTADSVETRNDRVLDDDIANIMIDTDVAETNAWENMTGEDRAMLAVSELKKLGNTARHKINKHCLLNTFESGKILCKNLKQQREKEIIADQRRLDIIYLAVKYFKMKMRDRIRRLDIAIAKSKQCTRVYELSLMEEKYREIRQTKKWKVGSKI